MLSILQQEVFNKAKKVLKVGNWYNGVCLYDFPTDEEIEKEGIDNAVSIVYSQTAYWDAPNQGF